MRLIDADQFEVIGGKIPPEYNTDSYLAGNIEILDMIDKAPTINTPTWIPVKDCPDDMLPQMHELVVGAVRCFTESGKAYYIPRLCIQRGKNWWWDYEETKPVVIGAFIPLPRPYKED